MKTSPIVPARIAFEDGGPRASDFGDVYHPRAGALAQAEHVFLCGNALPGRWRGRRRFVVLETGFGLGNNFLATWARWRSDPERSEWLHYLAVDLRPPRLEDLRRAHDGTLLPEAADALVTAWPPLTPDTHRLVFEDGRVELLLAFGDVLGWLRGLRAQVDAFYLDGFAPACNPQMWSQAVFDALPALAAPDATAATWSVAREVRDGLQRNGFVVERAPGFADKREMTVAQHAPRHRVRPAPAQRVAVPEARAVLVVGAGLAGAAVASALAEQGHEVTVLDTARRPAAGASGNPGGLFRSVVHADDGPHARWHRAAALEAARQFRPLVERGAVAGTLCGVLRYDDDLEAMRRTLAALGLPEDHLRALDAEAAGAVAGLPPTLPAWHLLAGGWMAPVALVRHWIEASGAAFLGGRCVAALRRHGERWHLVGPRGELHGRASVVVLANGVGAGGLAPHALWQLRAARGQLTLVPPGVAGLHAPRVPVAGNGYALTLPSGSVLCGATHDVDDRDPAVREHDHRRNLGTLARLTGRAPELDAAALDGRVGWRCTTSDRLPLVGAVPADVANLHDVPAPLQAQRVPRAPGLFVLSALGARGIGSAPLAARIVAGQISGAPLPVDARLFDAVDAARFVARAARRRDAGTSTTTS